MGPWYGYTPPPPHEQHQRLAALRRLTSREIPCILWAEDALNYVHRVPTCLNAQQILVPDDLLESASSVLQEGRPGYVAVPFTPEFADYFDGGGQGGPTPFPRGILLNLNLSRDVPLDAQAANINEVDPLLPAPTYILLLPQSYFALDVRDKERFQSLVPPLPPSNAGILAPKYHTFLEGLVAFNIDPPIPLAPTPHVKQRVTNDIFIGYLLRYRVQYEVDVLRSTTELLPEERKILAELTTEEARWYIGKYFRRIAPGFDELREYNRRRLG